MQENQFQGRGNCRSRGNNTEITRKSCEKCYFRLRKSSTKFYFKVRKPHLKLRNSCFKRDLEKKGKSNNASEFDVKMVGLFFIFFLILSFYWLFINESYGPVLISDKDYF